MEDLSRVIAGLRPTKKLRVIDLAREAGFDTTDWANSSSRSRNPKYCYAWTFLQPGKVVILNVWFDEIVSVGGRVEKPGNMVTRISIEKEARKTRAKEFDKNLQTAFREQLPVRLIIMDGRADGDHNARAESRGLDPVPWSVETYEADGSYNLVRQYPLLRYVDQFSEIGDALPTERDLVLALEAYPRSREVRDAVLKAARGRCEYCGVEGFRTPDGSVYLESHHIIPLCEQGPDVVDNVVALCANHHREAHFGSNRHEIAQELTKIATRRRFGIPGTEQTNSNS